MSFIIKPLITEKMTNITEKSSTERTYKAKTGKHRGEMVTKKAHAKYGFIVKPQANKVEIAKAIEEIFGVTVIKVTTTHMRGKTKRVGANPSGTSKSWKKAVVKLSEDSKNIEIFENMA